MSKFRRFYIDGEFEGLINKELKGKKIIKWDIVQHSPTNKYIHACLVVEYK